MLRMNDNSHEQFGAANARRDGRIRDDQSARDLVGSGTGGRLQAGRAGAVRVAHTQGSKVSIGELRDNGSEFLNYKVVDLLNKLLVEEFTKSRAYRTTDNAQVEGKNGAVVRKHIGYGPIGAPHAEELQKFFTAHFNPYLNYPRPCGFAVSELGAGGKKKRIYRTEDYQTPYEKLTSLPDWRQYLKAGLRPAALQQQAGQMSDTEAARRMKKAKLAVLQKCREKP